MELKNNYHNPDRHDKYDCKVYGDPTLKKPCGLSQIIDDDDGEFENIDRNTHDEIRALIDSGKIDLEFQKFQAEIDYQMQRQMNELRFAIYCTDACIECAREETFVDRLTQFVDTLTMPVWKFVWRRVFK